MKIFPTALPGVLLLEPAVFSDEHGFFLETWQAARYRSAGVPDSSDSSRDTETIRAEKTTSSSATRRVGSSTHYK